LRQSYPSPRAGEDLPIVSVYSARVFASAKFRFEGRPQHRSLKAEAV
jgi:hypothetical protein